MMMEACSAVFVVFIRAAHVIPNRSESFVSSQKLSLQGRNFVNIESAPEKVQ